MLARIDKDSAVIKSINDWHEKMIVQWLHSVKDLFRNLKCVVNEEISYGPLRAFFVGVLWVGNNKTYISRPDPLPPMRAGDVGYQ